MKGYGLLFTIQSIGAFIMLKNAPPIYRSLLSGNYASDGSNLYWIWAVLLSILPAYWLIRKRTPRIGNTWGRNGMISGHVVLFIGRMIFVFVGGLFSAVFYMRENEFKFTSGLFYLIALLFSMFCYTLEIEKVGRELIAKEGNQ